MDDVNTGLRTVGVTRYVTPLREGGSLPAIAEADDGFLYVLKFRGAGQGPRALIAELIGGEVARLLGLRIPELVLAVVDEAFGRTEGDEEIQDLLKASTGLNLGLHYLSGAFTFDPRVTPVAAETASLIVWLDAFLMNVDRTARNTNLLVWHKELWLIDHGASLYFHHASADFNIQSRRPFPPIREHVLLRAAAALEEADRKAQELLTAEGLKQITGMIPEEWLEPGEPPEVQRNRYADFLIQRLEASEIFVKEAQHAREILI